MSTLNNILKTLMNFDSTNAINIYLNCGQENENTITPLSMKNKNKLKKPITKTMTESYFRNIIRITENEQVKYVIRSTHGFIKNSMLFLEIKSKEVSEENFPVLHTYHYEITKTIDIYQYDTVDLIHETSEKNDFYYINIRDTQNKKDIMLMKKDIMLILDIFNL